MHTVAFPYARPITIGGRPVTTRRSGLCRHGLVVALLAVVPRPVVAKTGP